MIFNEELMKPYISNKQGKKFMENHKFYMIKLKRFLTKGLKKMIFSLEIKFWDGIHGEKTKANMESLNFYGKDLMWYMVTEVTIIFSSRI